ncbi:Lactoylglutathione lyase; AltName: Full=Aldoketomutase; AltName: Full=Glyoxalase I; Short=Glx I; AltName: Full=Ketone-aldehyde mutase; AltName: Full=Methylglyoxalase; AltName: Full=S-D-lactoylglutathione methylglyoxal lyase [Serendipita indica DSM 11827]|nr:Lactoylglutathione lyase; AltName: Full=Aldoketomutase; AltName: Full=Glyoxalase I; Short=Glx I; AltName: Full=Ketone-aldehyde mutase; AltName: Full=Methylglyoxalase; AltName: Full=S-D-lactoylglutathione methylglyoxal lyase [Serendipita indica DSM 11827]
MSQPAETQGYGFNHTMIRVKDPKPSLEFYQNVLGMSLIRDVRAEKKYETFTLYFLGYDRGGDSLKESHIMEREAILELTHNHGTETDENFQGYASGNTEPGRGFGHIAITVPNIQEACGRFERLNVPFKKRLTDGKMKEIAFILDPDGYWVEIIQKGLRL